MMRRIEVWLAVVFVLVAGAWGLLWWLVAARAEAAVEEALAASADGAVAVTCEERRRRGFPFRFEMVCSGAAAAAADGSWRARLERLTAGALLRRPRHIEAILQGPLAVDAAALERPAAARWASARAELVADRDGPHSASLRLFSFAAEIADLRLAVHQARLAVAPDEAGGSRLALAAEQLRLTAAGRQLPPVDLQLEAQLPVPAEALLAGAVDPTDGLSLGDVALRLETTQVQAFAEGALAADAEGVVSGSLTLHLVGIERLPALIEALPEDARGAASVAVGGLIALAAPAEWQGQPARRVVLTIEAGEVRAGPLRLGRLPPLWRPPPAF